MRAQVAERAEGGQRAGALGGRQRRVEDPLRQRQLVAPQQRGQREGDGERARQRVARDQLQRDPPRDRPHLAWRRPAGGDRGREHAERDRAGSLDVRRLEWRGDGAWRGSDAGRARDLRDEGRPLTDPPGRERDRGDAQVAQREGGGVGRGELGERPRDRRQRLLEVAAHVRVEGDGAVGLGAHLRAAHVAQRGVELRGGRRRTPRDLRERGGDLGLGAAGRRQLFLQRTGEQPPADGVVAVAQGGAGGRDEQLAGPLPAAGGRVQQLRGDRRRRLAVARQQRGGARVQPRPRMRRQLRPHRGGDERMDEPQRLAGREQVRGGQRISRARGTGEPLRRGSGSIP